MDTTANDGNRSHPAQFNLRTLLFTFALLSVPLTLLHWLGSYFLLPILFSTCLVCFCSFAYRASTPKPLLLVALIAIPIAFVFSFFYAAISFGFSATETLMFHVLLNGVACAACAISNCPRKVLPLILCVTAIIPYYLRIGQIEEVRQRFDQMLADHPLESLEPRLEFEQQPIASQVGELSTLVANNLNEQEQRRDWQRQWALTELHERYNAHFARAAGFGYMRMRSLQPEDLEPLPVETVKLPIPVDASLLSEQYSTVPNKLHQTITFDFLDTGKIGYVRDKRHVAGFQPHSVTALTDSLTSAHSCGEDPDEDAYWQLTRLELVSLLRHTPPRVYLAESLPAMDELDQFEHRALSEFERESLNKLRAEHDVVADESDGRILMLGALRAGNDCLACHGGSRGRLLGAFSYEFARLDTTETAPPDLAVSRPSGRFQVAAHQQ